MVTGILRKVFGSRNDRLLRTYAKTVTEINGHEGAMVALSDEALQAKTGEFKQRLAAGESLDDLLPEAFAVVREGSRRALGMRHFDVQLIGGMVLHYGKIAEMRTGEGKTLTATLAVYLNALTGQGVHVVTVNDYLAMRDAEWMGRLYRFLGMTVGVNLGQMPHAAKQEAYACDITYGTNNEFGFDYLRDNMVYELHDRVQRSQNYAIVDEVDSILIDEARTPLIISGQAEDHTELYVRINAVPALLTRMTEEAKPGEPEPAGDFWVDEKARSILLSEAGHEKAETILGDMGLLSPGASLYDPANILLMHHLMAAVRAHYLYHRDQHYVVQDNEIVIVDEFTGRLMTGRRWSDGLHQAVEAKEGVRIQNENQTLASITFQNYFRLFNKLGGMTGTADTEAYEFQEIYGLETVVIPTNQPNARTDRLDQVYKSSEEKYRAVIRGIAECHNLGQPVLVGTTSIESSELLSKMLTAEKLPHQVLNAKQHAREAEIVAQAGRPGVITIATNMAGRGTDIVLGGNVEKQIDLLHANADIGEEERNLRIEQLKNEWQALHDAVIAAGGLHIIGTERHESRRVDNQLRGRSGRQGDPGSSRFYLSLDDPLLRIFAGDRVRAIMDRLKMPEDEPIEAGLVMRSIESAQRKVEARNFDVRKQLLEYDDVSNDQRKVIYQQRNELLASSDISETITSLRQGVVTDLVHVYVPEGSLEEQWDLPGLERTLAAEFQVHVSFAEMMKNNSSLTDEDIVERAVAEADRTYALKVEAAGREQLSRFERSVMLTSIDSHWREHLAALDHLRQGIHLRSFAQKNPKQEYKREAFELFSLLLTAVGNQVTRDIMSVNIRPPEGQPPDDLLPPAPPPVAPPLANVQYKHAEFDERAVLATAAQDPDDIALAALGAGAVAAEESKPQPQRRFNEKVGRNDPCPCGSGKKYKACHGKLD
jgi:preprotein translocase subunit SecA